MYYKIDIIDYLQGICVVNLSTVALSISGFVFSGLYTIEICFVVKSKIDWSTPYIF